MTPDTLDALLVGGAGCVVHALVLLFKIWPDEGRGGFDASDLAADHAAVALTPSSAGRSVTLDRRDGGALDALHNARVAEVVDHDIAGGGVLVDSLRLVALIPRQQAGAGGRHIGKPCTRFIKAKLRKAHTPGVIFAANVFPPVPVVVKYLVGVRRVLFGPQLPAGNVQNILRRRHRRLQ